MAIARPLCMEPQLILFDDPTSALDPLLVGKPVETIRRLAQFGIAMLIVSNEPYLIRSVVNLVILIDGGVWQEIIPPAIIFSNPKKEDTPLLRAHHAERHQRRVLQLFAGLC